MGRKIAWGRAHQCCVCLLVTLFVRSTHVPTSHAEWEGRKFIDNDVRNSSIKSMMSIVSLGCGSKVDWNHESVVEIFWHVHSTRKYGGLALGLSPSK